MTETLLVAASPTDRAVLHVLHYFGIFRYPLSVEEVTHFVALPGAKTGDIADALNELAAKGRIFRFGQYFQTDNDTGWLAARLDYNRRAGQFLPLAHRMSRFIGAFPFVRAVCVSGSLSKNCMSPDGDIDYFVITAPGRLWLARTLLVIFKKTFLFNSHKYFCINYFIDTEHLEIEEKNIYTATETVTLLPTYGSDWMQAFRSANQWAWDTLPNFPPRRAEGIPPHRRGWLKRLLERLLGGRLGAWLDQRAMRLTVGYWQRKFSGFDRSDFDVALKSRRYVSKHHPLFFQKKVLDALGERIGSAS
ncbi:MAG: hypothetical protein U0U46_07450 [Saprospiraceae bacterium]